MTRPAPDLLPCPFCGAPADMVAQFSRDPSAPDQYFPVCIDCGATMDSAEDWNRRATPAPQAASAVPIELPPLPHADPHFNKNSGFACALHTNYTLQSYARATVLLERQRLAATPATVPAASADHAERILEEYIGGSSVHSSAVAFSCVAALADRPTDFRPSVASDMLKRDLRKLLDAVWKARAEYDDDEFMRDITGAALQVLHEFAELDAPPKADGKTAPFTVCDARDGLCDSLPGDGGPTWRELEAQGAAYIKGRADERDAIKAQPAAAAQPVAWDPHPREQLFLEINLERDAQDQQWGGSQHDSEHDAHEWLQIIDSQIHKARMFGESKQRFIKIAALAIAAIESGNVGRPAVFPEGEP